MKLSIIHSVLLFFLITGCADKTKEDALPMSSSQAVQFEFNYKDIIFDTLLNQEHFRGLSIEDNLVVIAGSQGTRIQLLMTPDLQSEISIDSLGHRYHFRDVEVREGYNLFMAIQNPSQISKDSFDTLTVIYENLDTTCFLDGMDFWKNGQGIIFGDPMHGKHFILKSEFDGNSWERISNDNIPEPIKNEAGFAASGTSIVCIGDGVGYIGWGGDEVRVFKTTDYGNTWKAQLTPMPKNQSGTGIYSMAFKDEMNGVAVGGNWEYSDCDSSKIYTKDGGKTWHLSNGVQGYRSCVTYLKDQTYISTGTNGTDISIDGGKSWTMLDTIGFNAIQFDFSQSKILGIGVGNYGLIKLLELTEK
jgi:photosystem II stability/assembly factor-like uncharacterized protein